MREKQRRRWVVRIVGTVAVGVAILGGQAAASADDSSSTGTTFHQAPVQPSWVGTVTGDKTDTVPVYHTDDVIWG